MGPTHPATGETGATLVDDEEDLTRPSAEEGTNHSPDDWHNRNPLLRRRYSHLQQQLQQAETDDDQRSVRRIRHQMDRIGSEFYELNKGLAVSRAQRFRSRDNSTQDYTSEAALGLWEAFLRWDPDRGVTFATFSRNYISGRVQRSVHRGEYQHLTQADWSFRSTVRRVQHDLLVRLERSPTSAEIAAELGATEARVDRVLAAGAASLDAQVGDSTTTLGDLAAQSPDATALLDEHPNIEEYFHDLSDLEVWVLQSRSRLLGGDAQSLVEISDSIGIGREVVRRAEARGRARIAAAYLRDELGREPTADDIAQLLGADVGQVTSVWTTSWQDLQVWHARCRSQIRQRALADGRDRQIVVTNRYYRFIREFLRCSDELLTEFTERYTDNDDQPPSTSDAAEVLWDAFCQWRSTGPSFPTYARKQMGSHYHRRREPQRRRDPIDMDELVAVIVSQDLAQPALTPS